MPRFDECHDQVVRALKKDKWRIVQEHAYLYTENHAGFVDIKAEKIQDDNIQQVILIEVKCFPNATPDEIHNAVGQYLFYQAILTQMQDPTPLYLAIPLVIYQTFFDAFIKQMFYHSHIQVVIVDLANEEIVQWNL
jgi:hypothetical protein